MVANIIRNVPKAHIAPQGASLLPAGKNIVSSLYNVAALLAMTQYFVQNNNVMYLVVANIIRNVPKAHIAPQGNIAFADRQKHRIIAFTRLPFREILTSLRSSE